MEMTTGAGEPPFRSWRRTPLAELASDLAGEDRDARRVVAIAGRSGGGKSTLTGRLRAAIPRSASVETDDLAWHEPMFAWADAAAEHVLRPFREGRRVAYRPPAWEARDRAGEIVVEPGVRVLLLEGVGASRRELMDLVDVAVWVQSDLHVAERLGIARDQERGVNGDAAESVRFWHWWMDQEVAFYADDRPWERADVVVAGTHDAPHETDHVLVAERD